MEGLSDKREATFRKQVIKKFLSRNKDIILSIRTYFNYDRWNVELVANPESPVPLPMLIIRKRDRIDLVLSRIITKIHSVLTNFCKPSL